MYEGMLGGVGGAPVSPDKVLGQVYGEVPVEAVGRGGGDEKKKKKCFFSPPPPRFDRPSRPIQIHPDYSRSGRSSRSDRSSRLSAADRGRSPCIADWPGRKDQNSSKATKEIKNHYNIKVIQ